MESVTAVGGWHGATPPRRGLSSKKRSRSNAKTSHTPTREIRAGDLMLLAKRNKEGGIVHALQPHIVPEIIARIDHRTRRGDGLCQRWGADPCG